jgi:putative peptidoglycan lipid II flippase
MSKGKTAARAAGKVSVAVMASRILGLVRDQFFAGLFGAGLYNDAWLVALRIPNMLRDLFAEGALSAAFVPTFTKFLKGEGRKEAFYLANLVMGSLMVLLGILTLFLFFFSDFFVSLLAAGFSGVEGKVEVTSTLVKIVSPFLMLLALASVAAGMLNTLDHFFIPALAPAIYNVSLILAAIFLVPRFEANGFIPIYAMGCGALIGGFLQYGILLYVLKKEGYSPRLRLSLSHPGIRKIAKLIGPAIIGVSAVQLSVLINTQIASFLDENGPVSWLSYAFRIFYLPIGLFGVAVGVVNLRDVSAHAVAGHFEELKETVANSVKMVVFMAIPATIGLLLLARPIVDVLFERGGFTAADTVFTSYAVMGYAIGLVAYSANKVFVPTYYAIGDTRTPVKISLLAVAGNVLMCILLVLVLPDEIRFVGLAAATSFSALLNTALLVMGLTRKLGSFAEYQIKETLIRIVFLSLVMGLTVFLLQHWIDQWMGDMNLFSEIWTLAVVVGSGILVYFTGAYLLRIKEFSYLLPRR